MTREETISYAENKAVQIKERIISDQIDNIPYGKYAMYSTELEFLSMTINALREQEERRWIPVTERLPEIGRKCLIANGEIVKIGWIRPDGVWKTGVRHNDLWGRFSLYPPTHWMPLPEPSKED